MLFLLPCPPPPTHHTPLRQSLFVGVCIEDIYLFGAFPVAVDDDDAVILLKLFNPPGGQNGWNCMYFPRPQVNPLYTIQIPASLSQQQRRYHQSSPDIDFNPGSAPLNPGHLLLYCKSSLAHKVHFDKGHSCLSML